jgi:hypothetical protein
VDRRCVRSFRLVHVLITQLGSIHNTASNDLGKRSSRLRCWLWSCAVRDSVVVAFELSSYRVMDRLR